jgi:hypothetical protein
MGTLVVMRYPTKLVLGLADHTYVKCGTGRKAWSCWGGKIGGTELRRGAGSTKQSDAIAEPDERAGIKCYGMNGVCHQAANRILFPAGITVRGALGYDVSENFYGTYGRPRGPFGTCLSPFNQHTGVTGDLTECIGGAPVLGAKAIPKIVRVRSIKRDKLERKYLKGVLAIYRQAESLMTSSAKGIAGSDLESFQVKLFMYKAQFSLGTKLSSSLSRKLQDIRRSAERSRMKIEDWFTHEEMKASEFVVALNKEIVLFQEAAAGVLKVEQYKALFGLKPGDNVILADPRIMKQAYADK